MMFWAAVLCSSLSLVGVSAQDESSLLNKSMFLPTFSPAKGFHTREALTEVGRSSRASGTSGDSDTTHKRELAASDSAQTSDQTTVVLCSSLCLIVVGIPAPDVGSLVSKSLFDLMLKHRNDADCPAKGFYTYEAFMEAANSFGAFGTTADADTRKREIAAFLAQTSQETTGGWATAPDGPYAWGYCYNPEQRAGVEYYCVRTQRWPCAAGKNYRGRGPFQLAYNYNYGQAGEAIGADLINNPELVTTDAVISFKTAMWFWMTPQSPKPSCHDAMTGRWRPSKADSSAGRVPGYGLVTNLINGGIECGGGNDTRMLDRIGFYKRYCDILGVSYGNNLDCARQRPFGA